MAITGILSFKKYGLPLGAGILLFLIFLFPILRPLVFLPPLLFLVFLNRPTASSREAALGLWFGFFVFVLGVFWHLKLDSLAWRYVAAELLAQRAIFWLLPLFFIFWILASAWVALPYGILGMVFSRLKRNDFGDVFLFASLWVLAEFSRKLLFFGFGWVDLGYWFFDAFPSLGITSRLVGVSGLSFLAVVLAGLFFTFLFDPGKKSSKKLILALSVAFLFLSLFVFGKIVTETEKKEWRQAEISVAVLHGYLPWGGNVPRKETASGLWLAANYAELLDSLKEKNTEIVVLPEEVLEPINTEAELYRWLQEKKGIQEISRNIGAKVFILGQSLVSGDKLLNSFLIFDAGSEPQIYAKSRLFPFVEYLPRGFSFLRNAFPGTKFFDRGEEAKIPRTTLGRLGIFSCLELLLPDFVRSRVRDGSQILVSGGSEIAWEKPVWEQDLLISRFQAASNRRYLLRAMKEGYSVIANPLGEIISQSDGKRDTILQSKVSFLSEKTFYTLYGDWPVIFFSFLILGRWILFSKPRKC